MKSNFRCRVYRGKKCRGKAEYIAQEGRYFVVREHTCRNRQAFDNENKVDITDEMKDTVDRIATCELAATALQIWNAVNAHFYLPNTTDALIGLTREQVINRVYNTCRQHYGGNIHGLIELPPLSLVKGSNQRFFFFHFHHIFYEDDHKDMSQPQRIIGWAHPDLVKLLKYSGATVFVDGTFRCVHSHFRQCVIIMLLDQATGLYIPVFYVLCTSKTQDTY